MYATSRLTRTLSLGAAVLLVLALPAGAEQASDESDEIEPRRPAPSDAGAPDDPDDVELAEDLYFVQFARPPAAEGTSRSALRRERAAFRDEAAAEDVAFRQRADFRRLFNGLSVRASEADATRLSRLRSVEAVFPVALIDVPDTDTADPDLATALAMTGADIAQSELGLSGEGVQVAVMDTGIDYQHPDLGGDGEGAAFPTARVTEGFDFVGDDFNASDPSTSPEPDDDPQDCNGHGTHVAGIVGADAASQDGVTGVAPAVTFGAYKVFGCAGSTTADIMISAMEMALEDGMDVLNMSIGSAFTWPQYPTAVASDNLVEQGMVVVASIGNSGASGVYSAGAPGLGSKVIGVASADNTFINAQAFVLDPESENEQFVPYIPLSGAEEPPTEGTSAPLSLVGNHGVVDDTGEQTEPGDETALGCEASDFDGFPAGDVAVIKRGTCRFDLKHRLAVEAGASGVVIYNNTPGLFAGGGDFVAGAWGVGVSDTSGALLVGLIQTRDEDVTLTFADERVRTANPTGGLASSFTSYGHSPDLALKPDIMAPGGLITSTFPLAQGGYATISGTSMASPHVAGAAALLMEDEPDLAAGAFRDRLQNTAEPALWSLAPLPGLIEHTFRQGAGMVQIDDAALATTAVTPGKLALGEGSEPVEATLTVTNQGDEAVTYDVSHRPAIQTGDSTFTPTFFLAPTTVNVPASVTLPAGGSVEVPVTVTPPDAGVPNLQYGGYVVMTPQDEAGVTLRVPYAGFDGDYQALPVFGYFRTVRNDDGVRIGAEVVAQEPRLSKITEDGLEPVGDGHVFRPRQGDFPVVEAFQGHHPQRVELIAHSVRRDRSWTVFTDEFLRRSPGPDDYWPYPWDGTVPVGRGDQTRPVPPGIYRLEFRALKALGDPGNPEHWETWTSPTFKVRVGRGPGGPPPGRGR